MSSCSQTVLVPLEVVESATMQSVLATEAEWRDALLRDPRLLEEVLGAPVETLEREPQVGPFFADLALTAGGLEVLVELQLGGSDARHLGQVTRYALYGRADLVLWLCDDVHAADAKAVATLNKVLETKILPVSVHTLRIPATGRYLLYPRVIEGREFALGKALADGPASPRDLAYQRFWRLLIARVQAAGLGVFTSHSPGRQKWIRTSLRPGSWIYVRVAVAANSLRVGIQVDSGDDAVNGAIWDELELRRDRIEAAVDAELEWRAPGRTGVIETRLEGGYASRPESGSDNVVDVLAQLVPVMNQLLNEIPLSAMNLVDHPQINLL